MTIETRLTDWQATGLVISTILPTAILTVPKAVVPYSFQAAWLSIILAALLALLVAYVACALCERYPGRTIFEIVEHLFGRTASILFGMLLALYYFIVAFYILYQFADFMTATVMPETPVVSFCILIMLLVVYALHLGLGTIARVNMIVLAASLFTLGLRGLLVAREADFYNLLPFTEIPFSNILMGVYAPFGWLSEVTVIWLLAPAVSLKKSLRKVALIGVAVTSAMLLFVLLEALLVFKPQSLSLMNYPTFSVFRKISVGEVIERTDPFFIAVWTSSVVMKVIIFMFGATYCLCKPLNISQRGPVLFALAVLAVVYASVSWESTIDLSSYSAYTFPMFVYIFNVGLPLVLLLISLMKRKGKIQ